MDLGISGIRELPERLCVETRFVTRDMIAVFRGLTCQNNGNSSFSNWSTQPSTTGAPSLMPKNMVNTEVMTDNPNPMRDRDVQTEIKARTIGIQCNVDQMVEDIAFQKLMQPEKGVSNVHDIAKDKESFQNFIKTKTYSYPNGKVECLLCGEIKSKEKLMESHMALHWGPAKLCFRCGLHFEHKSLWKEHNCVHKRTDKEQLIKCPQYFCTATAISPMELYDHLNEHCHIKFHKCPNCCKSYSTAEELRCHFRVFKKCSPFLESVQPSNLYKMPVEDTKYRKRVRVYKTKSGKRIVKRLLRKNINHTRFCNICMRRCKSPSIYQLHVKRCLKVYKARLKEKRITAAVHTLFTNNTDSN